MAFKMSGWSAFTKEDEKKVIVTDKDTGKKIDKDTGEPVNPSSLEEAKLHIRPHPSLSKSKKVTKVERSEKSKRMEEQRKKMKKQ